MGPKGKSNAMAQKAKEHLAKLKAEEDRIKAEEERIRLEELEKERLEQERLQKIEEERLEKERIKREKKEKKIRDGTYLTSAQKKALAAKKNALERGFVTTSSTENAGVVDVEDESENISNIYRSLIVVVQGNVDVGKTLLLDYIRGSHIQSKEAAGITQQIGASYKSKESLQRADEVLFPGFLFIDTPGHEAFSNLRSRGSSICDIAIIVVDLMHGIERQTEESIQSCIDNKIPFIIALNKCDRMFGWDANDKTPIIEKVKSDAFKAEFDNRFYDFSQYFYRKQFNTSLDFSTENDVINVCPVSAMTGEGIDELLFTAAKFSQEKFLDLLVKTNELKAVIMESKHEARVGATIDVILINGELQVGDKIGFSTLKGPVVTTIKSLLIPEECTEMRMSQSYVLKRKVEGACGVRIVANNMDNAIPGSKVIKTENISEIEEYKSQIEIDREGITVFAPTIGQLEALLKFLRVQAETPVKVGHVSIGSVFRKDIIHLTKYIESGKTNYNCILCFDCDVADADEVIQENRTQIFTGDTIYRLYENYMVWFRMKRDEDDARLRRSTVFPCELSLLPGKCFRKTNPIILGVKVEKGRLRSGIKLFNKKGILGNITSIRDGDKDVEEAVKGSEVSICIDTDKIFGRAIDYSDSLYSYLTAETNNILRNNFQSELCEEEIKLYSMLNKVLKIR